MTDFDSELQRLFTDDDQRPVVRIEALASLGPRREQIEEPQRRFISTFLRSDADLLLRLRLAGAYASGPCSEIHCCTIAGLTQQLGPTFVSAFWPAYSQSTSTLRQKQLLRFLREFDDLPGVSDQQLRELLVKFSDEAQAEAGPLLDRLVARRAAAAERIEHSPVGRRGGCQPWAVRLLRPDRRVQPLPSRRERGAQVGPDLTKIAAIRQPRDLVESILLPSASFARDFHAWTAVTTEGRAVSGLITRQTADAVVFRLTDLSEVRLPRAEIELLKESETSIMPQGLEAKLNEQEFRDLLAYLQSLR